MGGAKNEGMRKDDMIEQAKTLLVKVGAARECEWHEGEFIDRGDDEALRRAYPTGANMVKRGEVDGTHKEFMEAIDIAKDLLADECFSCAKMRRE